MTSRGAGLPRQISTSDLEWDCRARDTMLMRLKALTEAYCGKWPRIDAAAHLARAITAKSRDLMEGRRGDLIILQNDSGKAPSVVCNLRGEPVFEDRRGPPVCIIRPCWTCS